jgi:hypothetical protein
MFLPALPLPGDIVKLTAAIVILLATGACGLPLLSQMPAALPQGPATVHIYRTGSHGNAIKVMIDRQEAFKVSNHELITFQLSAGPHEIAAPYADRKPMVEINLRPGKEYFFELAFKVRRAGAVFGIIDPADAIGLELIRQPAIIDPARVHERLLSAYQLAWISSLHSPVPDP